MERSRPQQVWKTIGGALLGLSLVLSACGSEDAVKAGQRIYARRCYACHGETGVGDGPTARLMGIKPANLRRAVREKPKAKLLEVITRGRQAMPAFGPSLTEVEREAVVQYLRTLPEKKAAISRGLDPAGIQGLR